MSAALDAALAYAARGWAVFPLVPNAKTPMIKRWQERASTEPGEIRAWWTRKPDANIGLATGRKSKVVGLDIDVKNGIDGEASLRALENEHGALPPTLEQRTPSGGRHLIFVAPEHEVRNSAGRLAPGVDFRGDGGYIALTPSVLGERAYMWTNAGAEIAAAPGWIFAPVARRLPEGGRNAGLTSEGGRLRARGFEHAAIEHALRAANANLCDPPLDALEVQGIARGIVNHYPVRRTCTDLGNAERFVDVCQGWLRFCPQAGRWLRWDGTRWCWDADGAAHRAMREVVRGMYAEAAAERDEQRRATLGRWAARTEAKGALRAAVELAADDERALVNVAALDADLWRLGVRNGTLDLRLGELLPAAPEHLITKQALVAFDPGAQCPLWEGFLAKIFANDTELIGYVQRAIGYSLTGDTMAKTLFFLYGPGGDNGKSTLIETLMALLGDYALKTRAETFMQSKSVNTGATPERVALRGARLVVASELSDRQRFDENFLKDATGGIDRIAARNLYEGMIEFRPEFKLWLYGNHRPQLRADDDAAWRRLHLIPFEVRIPLADQDPQLGGRLLGELAGILNWALAGLAEWRTRGLAPPAKVLAAVGAYREDMDELGRFLSECVVSTPGAEIKAGDLYNAFRTWAEGEGNARPMGNARFSTRLRERGQAREVRHNRVFWLGIDLTGGARATPSTAGGVDDGLF